MLSNIAESPLPHYERQNFQKSLLFKRYAHWFATPIQEKEIIKVLYKGIYYTKKNNETECWRADTDNRELPGGQNNLSEDAQEVSVDIGRIKRWGLIYENEGSTGLLPVKENRHYSKELKIEAVLDYLNGSEALDALTKNMVYETKNIFETG